MNKFTLTVIVPGLFSYFFGFVWPFLMYLLKYHALGIQIEDKDRPFGTTHE